ncbi:DyP-type peroxidase [Mycena venus]|uniref:DyP-type peroxidase n=1 Tax=Mycena venus TaxID=2733690 RepID=A0A8H6X6X1_9AGAR|nr:DyP-type peroxidase [Mycena venus]
MKLNTLAQVISFGLCAQIVSVAGLNEARSLERRKTSILFNPQGLPQLPGLQEATNASRQVGLNLDDVQGDILIGMRKLFERFFFFGILNAPDFKAKLKTEILPLVTSTMQVIANETDTMLNIAFSQTGLVALNITGPTNDLNDAVFAKGQAMDAFNLGDPNTTNWVPEFVGTNIHGVMLLASDTEASINTTLADLQSKLGNSITEIYSLRTAMRPNENRGHEHFGFLDGISNPTVGGFQDPLPGQALVPTGEILVGETGDSVTRPEWAKDGSFLVFRQLKQLVPEFNKFLADNPINEPGLTPEQGSELLGARMVGRWKSGAPVFLSPKFDDPDLGKDPTRNNNFTFAEPGQNISDPTDQSGCPFSAHIRKTRPRADIGLPENVTSNHHIVRAGIPYGPEVTTDETSSNTTEIERGLAFVAYQSNIANGFQFLQHFWANNPKFVHQGVGFDPIIGANASAERPVNGLDPTNTTRNFTLTTDFVVSRGGEYFFSPSISAIANTLSV